MAQTRQNQRAKQEEEEQQQDRRECRSRLMQTSIISNSNFKLKDKNQSMNGCQWNDNQNEMLITSDKIRSIKSLSMRYILDGRQRNLGKRKMNTSNIFRYKYNYLLSILLMTASIMFLIGIDFISCGSDVISSMKQQQKQKSRLDLPDLVSATNDEPIVAVAGQDAYISCVANNLQNYSIIWRFTNEAHAPGLLAPDSPASLEASNNNNNNSSRRAGDIIDETSEMGTIISANRQRVTSDDRFSVIRSHNTWLLHINDVKLSDTGTYICQTNSEPKVRAIRILSVIKPSKQKQKLDQDIDSKLEAELDPTQMRGQHFSDLNHNFTDCCRAEYVFPRCQKLCTLEQLASKYNSISMVHECYSALPSITRCMIAGRNVTDCCQRRHIPRRCNAMCGHSLESTTSMSIRDQTYCADYSASILSCKYEEPSWLASNL